MALKFQLNNAADVSKVWGFLWLKFVLLVTEANSQKVSEYQSKQWLVYKKSVANKLAQHMNCVQVIDILTPRSH